MKPSQRFYLAICCAYLFLSSGLRAGQTEQTFKSTSSYTNEIRYLLALPGAYEKEANKRWPVILFLHGAGERGKDLSKVAVHGPPKLVQQGKSLPFIIISPQCPEQDYWHSEPLLALLDDVVAHHRADTNRIYLTGLSMGGFGSWNLATQYPERFAAVAPICGGGDTLPVLLSGGDRRRALQSLPFWAFHGGKDNVVPLAESERMIAQLKRAGVKETKLTVYPEAGHDSWTDTYNNEALYDWFLSHQRMLGASQ